MPAVCAATRRSPPKPTPETPRCVKPPPALVNTPPPTTAPPTGETPPPTGDPCANSEDPFSCLFPYKDDYEVPLEPIAVPPPPEEPPPITQFPEIPDLEVTPPATRPDLSSPCHPS